jgi:hypothetical protein
MRVVYLLMLVAALVIFALVLGARYTKGCTTNTKLTPLLSVTYTPGRPLV